MIRSSKRLADALGTSEMFLKAVESWLNPKDLRAVDSERTHILITLLKFISNLFDQLSATNLESKKSINRNEKFKKIFCSNSSP
eukprot:UN03784